MRDLQWERRFEVEFEVGWEFVEKFDLEHIDWEASKRANIRLGVPVIKETVGRYAIGMEYGDDFRAIVLYRAKGGKYRVIDGIQRIAAAKEVGLPVLDAYIVNIRGDANLLKRMQSSGNSTGSNTPTEEDEVQKAIHDVESLGITQKEAAYHHRLPIHKVNKGYRARKARLHYLEIGEDMSELSDTHLMSLSGLRDDNVFLAAGRLVKDSGMITTDTKQLVKELNKLTTVEEQLQLISDWEYPIKEKKSPSGAGFYRRLDNLVTYLSEDIGNPLQMQLASPKDIERVKEYRTLINHLLSDYITQMEECIP